MQPRWSFRHPAGAHISYSDEFENALPSCSISAIQSQLFDLSCSIWERDFGRLKHFCCVHIFGIFRFQSFRFAYKLFCFASKQNKLNKTFFSLFCFAHFRFRLASFRFEAKWGDTLFPRKTKGWGFPFFGTYSLCASLHGVSHQP